MSLLPCPLTGFKGPVQHEALAVGCTKRTMIYLLIGHVEATYTHGPTPDPNTLLVLPVPHHPSASTSPGEEHCSISGTYLCSAQPSSRGIVADDAPPKASSFHCRSWCCLLCSVLT